MVFPLIAIWVTRTISTVLILVLRMQMLGVFVGAGLWTASVSGRIRTARVPPVRAHYRHPHAPRVGDLATAHSRRAFSRPLRLAVRSTTVTALPADTEATQTLTMTSASRSPFHCSVRVLVCSTRLPPVCSLVMLID